MNEAIFIHPFEKAGLGKAPFRFDGYTEIVFQIPGQAPRAGGSCDYCGTGIRDAFYVKSSDGKRFKVGCDCIRKVEAKGSRLLTLAEKTAKETKKARAKVALRARVAAAHELMAANQTWATDRPHTHPYFASQGKTYRDMVNYLFAMGGAKGKTDACKIVERELAV